MPFPPVKRENAQELFDRNIGVIQSIDFRGGVKWPRFKPEHIVNYRLDSLQEEGLFAVPKGQFLVGPVDSNGKRQLRIIRSECDQGAVLNTSVLLTKEENEQIDVYLSQPKNPGVPVPQDILSRLIEEAVGFSDHSIVKLKTPEGGVRYSLKAGKGDRVGKGTYAAVKDEWAYCEFDAEGVRVPHQSGSNIVRSAAEYKEDLSLGPLNLYGAFAFGRSGKMKLPVAERLTGGKETHKVPAAYVVQPKSISLDRFIAERVVTAGSAASYASSPSFTFRGLPVTNAEEKDVLFRLAVDAINAVRMLHKKNVAHCDLKPGNFLLTAEQRLKLTDFGFSVNCSGVADGLDGFPAQGDFRGTPMQLYDVTKKLSYREIDLIALGKTLFMDGASVFLFLSKKKHFFTSLDRLFEFDPGCKNTFKKSLEAELGDVCLFPRDFVDARPALSLLLRSVKNADSAPYDIDTLLCAVLLEQHGLLQRFQFADKICIPRIQIDRLLAQFDRNPDVNPLNDHALRDQFFASREADSLVTTQSSTLFSAAGSGGSSGAGAELARVIAP